MDDFIAKPFDVVELIRMVLKLTHRVAPADSPAKAAVTEFATKPAAIANTDTKQGLGIWREVAVYQQYLRKFAREYGASLDELSQMETGAAAKYMHKMRGAAGNLALPQVSALTGAAEQTLVEGKDPADLYARLRVAMAATLESISDYAPEPAAAERPLPERVDRERVAALLAEALAACHADNPDAVEPVLDALGAQLPAQQLEPLREAVRNFDFRGAESVARTLAAELTFSLE